MPVKFEKKTVQMVTTTAESLKKVVDQLTQVAADMQHGNLKEALFPWTQRQWDCLDVVVTLANQCVASLPPQIVAKSQGRKSKFDLIQEKSEQRATQRKKPAARTKTAATGKR